MTPEQRQTMITHWRKIGRVYESGGSHTFKLPLSRWRELRESADDYWPWWKEPLWKPVTPGTPDYPRAHFAWLMAEMLEQGEGC